VDHTERSAAAAATERSSTKALLIGVCAQVNDFAQSYTDVLDSPRLLGADRTNFGLPAAGVVYANYNNLQKLQPWVFDGWCGSVVGTSTDSAARVQQNCNHSCYARRPTR
jgi:predicted O-linked N-acetylglucosamine transferase (SPINDLY family)